MLEANTPRGLRSFYIVAVPKGRRCHKYMCSLRNTFLVIFRPVLATMSPVDTSLGGSIADYLPNELAPLLTLFGEQVTKQFLSLCVGWPDIILLSMGPIGVITIIVSTIRVGGMRFLKGLVGR